MCVVALTHSSLPSRLRSGPAVRLLLYKLTRQQKYADDFNRYMDTWLALPKTPKGLAFYLEWGPLRYSANTAFLALLAADYGIKPDKFRAFAVSQVTRHS